MKKYLQAVFLICLYLPSYAQKNEISLAFKNREYEKAIELGKQLVELHPNDYDGLLVIGKSYNLSNNFKNAIPYLHKAIDNCEKGWQFAWANIELMESHFALGNKNEAYKHFKESLNYKGTQNSNKKLRRLALLFGFGEYYEEWKTIEGQNVIFHFQEGVKINDKKKYIKERERVFMNINSFFLSNLPKKIDFFVWKSNEEAIRILGTPLGFTNPQYCISHNRPNQTKGHEIAHNISFWISNNIERTRFINEGIGVYFDHSNKNRILQAKRVANNKEIDVKKLWIDGETYSEEVIYPVAGAFVEHLISIDKEKFIELSKNQVYENAKLIYGQELDKIISRFNKKINKE
ncbi:tetratricopeptide repeat protein [Flagellimonas onchidii]|uniref:tetratricopeptide repeat protein n=1 Tax=Flagellimonas onchidii TaxID=2562684 RepID=UPI0010A6914A|nr:hypothetical protein [Allomuricauda onchidii]